MRTADNARPFSETQRTEQWTHARDNGDTSDVVFLSNSKEHHTIGPQFCHTMQHLPHRNKRKTLSRNTPHSRPQTTGPPATCTHMYWLDHASSCWVAGTFTFGDAQHKDETWHLREGMWGVDAPSIDYER